MKPFALLQTTGVPQRREFQIWVLMVAVQNETYRIEGVMLSGSTGLIPSQTIGGCLASFLDSSVTSARLLFSVWVLIIHVERLELGCWLLGMRGVDLFAHWCILIVKRFIIITIILVSVVYDQSGVKTSCIGTYTVVGLELNRVTCKKILASVSQKFSRHTKHLYTWFQADGWE